MRDNQGCTSLHQVGKSLLHLAFGTFVQIRGRFIKNQDRGVFQQSPRDGDALPLSTGQHKTTLPKHSFVSLRQLINKRICQGGSCRLLDHFHRHQRAPVGNVVAHRVVEQDGFLRDDANLVAQISYMKITKVDAINFHGSSRRIVKTRDQVRDSTLTSAGAAAQSHGTTHRNFKAHTM